MSTARKELQEALHRYTADTLSYIHKVRKFCKKSFKWILQMESESDMVKDIKVRFDQMNLRFSHVTQAKKGEKGKAFREYMKSKQAGDSEREALEQELAAVLKATLEALEKHDNFLEAVEKLVVTSFYVFMEENHQMLWFTKGIGPEHIRDIIVAARLICPLLLEFKRDAAAFFLPKLQNVEVLSYQLDKYIQTTQKICEKFLKKSSLSEFGPQTTMEAVEELNVDLSEEDIRRMLDHINQLDEIRKNPNFRMVFLFQEESCSRFIEKFSECKPRMLQFLNDLDEVAVQLNKMNKGAKISSVAGSSVGAIGGVLSIVGLALIPVTAGLSLGLTITGVGLGITSGVNGIVTTATELGVNCTQQKKANVVFQSFMEDVQSLQDCLEEAKQRDPSDVDLVVGVGRVLCKVAAVGKGIDALVDAASAAKALQNEALIARAGNVVVQEGRALRNMSSLASDIPDVGQAVVKGPLALSKVARVGFIGVNALFVGMDVFFICKDSKSLAKGSETEVSQFIRARAALWSSEMDSWQKIHDSLCEGQEKLEKNEAILETRFYPEVEKKMPKQTEMEMEPSDEVNKKVKKEGEGEEKKTKWVLHETRWVKSHE